ncbi:MAG TPA: hypothetical protein VE961_04630, partial [Pyrinomonadaceae bacterium]|nr:hypothetical protein [Pyrinomonadaceae bacterium]
SFKFGFSKLCAQLLDGVPNHLVALLLEVGQRARGRGIRRRLPGPHFGATRCDNLVRLLVQLVGFTDAVGRDLIEDPRLNVGQAKASMSHGAKIRARPASLIGLIRQLR